jgi:hypothetical protein
VDSGNGFGARVFWTAVIPDSDVQVDPGAGKAEMHVRSLNVLDYASNGFASIVSIGPQWQTAYVPATVSFDVVWNGPVTRRVNIQDTANNFAGEFNENQATVTWSAQSSSGFSFTSNPGNFSTSVPEVPGVNGVTAPLNFFAELGHERNGIFFPGGGSAPAPTRSLAGATSSLSTLVPVAKSTVPLVATTIGGAQPTQSIPSLHRLRAGAALTRMVDQVFANQDGSTLSEAHRTDDALVWTL